MKRICCILLAMTLLLLFGCGEEPLSSDETVQTTGTTTVQTQEQQNKRAPSIVLNETVTVNAGTSQWSRIQDGKISKLFVDAPHPYRHYSENHPVLYTEKGGENTVSFSCEPSPKEVKVKAYKMSEKEMKAITLTVATADRKGTPVYTFDLLDDDFYAYTVTLYWDRYDGTDHAVYAFYSKVK